MRIAHFGDFSREIASDMGNSMAGRPLLFPDGKQISVLVSGEDFRSLSTLVEKTQVTQPNFGLGDLLRSYIRRCLEPPKQSRGSARFDPKTTRIRRLHAIARTARGLAKELETVEKVKPVKPARRAVIAG